MSDMRYFMNLEEAEKLVNKIRLKKPNKKIVTTNGCFDVLHYGHLKTFEQARELGDILLVGINSDAYIMNWKGRTPIHNENQRAYNLSRLRDVDGVVLFTQNIPDKFLRAIRPNIHVKSKEGYKGIEGPILYEFSGKLVLLDDLPGFSTTNILNDAKRTY
jgi:rfaE bifunctional protein nucleotidyltransferase chain/domain